jgi:hypothetical protein
MSEFIAAKIAEPQSSGQARDLQVHLYKEIGISAVVAALHVTAKPVGPKNDAALDERRIQIPAILKNEDLAA